MTEDAYVKSVKFKGSDDEYRFPLLSAKQCSRVFSNFTSLALPILSVSYEQLGDYSEQMEKIKSLGEEGDGLSPEVDLMGLSVLFSRQLVRPEFSEVLDGLIPVLIKNGQEVSLDNEFRGEFDKYLKIIELAFKENLFVPLKRYLEEKGLSGMLTSLQVFLTDSKEAMS